MIIQPILPTWVLVAFTSILFAIWLLAYRGRTKAGRKSIWWVRLAAVAVLLIMAMRPSIPGQGGATGTALVDVYFVVDNTYSMTAEDYAGGKTRIDGVRSDIAELTKMYAGARFALITFDNQPHFVTPLTTDASAISSELAVTRPPYSFDSVGSLVDVPLDTLQKELKRAASADPQRGRVVIFMSDGENTRSGTMRSFAPIKPYINSGAVLGYGTASGGKMRDDIVEGLDTTGEPPRYVEYNNNASNQNEVALSKLDEANLKHITSQMGVPYAHRTNQNGLNGVMNEINMDKVIGNSHDKNHFIDLYWLGAPLLFAFFGLEYVVLLERLRTINGVIKRGRHG